MNDEDGSRWIKMDQDRSKWIKMDQDGSKWIKMDQDFGLDEVDLIHIFTHQDGQWILVGYYLRWIIDFILVVDGGYPMLEVACLRLHA